MVGAMMRVAWLEMLLYIVHTTIWWLGSYERIISYHNAQPKRSPTAQPVSEKFNYRNVSCHSHSHDNSSLMYLLTCETIIASLLMLWFWDDLIWDFLIQIIQKKLIFIQILQINNYLHDKNYYPNRFLISLLFLFSFLC